MDAGTQKPDRRSITLLILAGLGAWCGLVLHTLTHPALSTFEQILVVITLVLLVSLIVLMIIRPQLQAARLGLLLVTIFHLSAAIFTVLPAPIFSPVPEQTITHYGIHALYGLAQLPLLALLYNWHTPPAR
jgi:hypothetical protein